MAKVFHQDAIICAVKDNDAILSRAIASKRKYIFLLKANINSMAEVVKRCHDADKTVFVHIDLAEGVGRDEASIKYIAEVVKPDGILSTKSNIVKLARDYGMLAIYRVFLVDAQAMDSAKYNLAKLQPDAIEIMPGIAYEAISELKSFTDIEIIGGGFVRTEQNVRSALQAGAVACSTSNEQLW